MAIRHVVTMGFGNGTFAGDIGRVVTLGYGIGTEVANAIAAAKMRRGGLLHGGLAGRLHSFAVLAITIGSMA